MNAILKNIINGLPCENRTAVTVQTDEKYVTVEFRCEHSGKTDTPYARYNDPIYRGEVVEFFIGEKGGKFYFEFDLAPNNTLFNARALYVENYGAFVKVIDEPFVLHSVERSEKQYVAKLKIPFEKIGGKDKTYEYNAYRIASDGEKKEFQALNPVGKIDFHCRDKFVELKIKDEK